MRLIRMISHVSIHSRELYQAIKEGEIKLAGNRKLKIYGLLDCKSGKRMLKQNRVFFVNEEKAKSAGYRPCGHCLRKAYQKWKNGII